MCVVSGPENLDERLEVDPEKCKLKINNSIV